MDIAKGGSAFRVPSLVLLGPGHLPRLRGVGTPFPHRPLLGPKDKVVGQDEDQGNEGEQIKGVHLSRYPIPEPPPWGDCWKGPKAILRVSHRATIGPGAIGGDWQTPAKR